MKDKRSKRHNSNWKNSKDKKEFQPNISVTHVAHTKPAFRPPRAVTVEQMRAEDEAIRQFKSKTALVCPHCSKEINDISSALNDRSTGKPIHFDCAVEIISKDEKLVPGDKITYIGQGRFGVLYFENPHDTKHFTIKKIIEWEGKETQREWRDEVAELYSRVK